MAFSRQEQERERQRNEERRQEALARRQEEDREAAREHARREEARQQRVAFEAELEAARVRREALIARIGGERRRERDAAKRLAERRSALIDRIVEEQQERRRVVEAATERRQRLLGGTAEARRIEDRSTERSAGAADARLEAAREDRTASERDAARRSERLATARAARAETRRERSSPGSGDGAAGGTDDRARTEQRDRGRSYRADLARRNADAAERAAAARDSRRAADAAERRRSNLAEQARVGTFAGRREQRREADRLARASAEQATERRLRQGAERRVSTERTAETRARSLPERSASRPTASAEPSQPARDPLDDLIPSGILSGSLPWLRVEGSRLVTLAGDTVTLRGANVVGLGPPGRGGDLAAAGVDEMGLAALLGLGVRAVRVPIDRDRLVVGAGGRSAADQLAELDRIIGQVASDGAYTVLSLQTLGDATFGTRPDGSGGRLVNPIAPRLDFESIGLWRTLGERYADEPAVLFDLFAAPHPALPDNLTGMDTDWDRWSLWVRLVVAELRLAHPRAVCIVAGLGWGSDLSGFPILGTANEPIPNLLYGATLSADRPEPPLRALAGGLPILVTELDAAPPSVATRAATLASLGIGWIAAARSDRPLVTAVRGGRLEPTVLGMSIRRVLIAIPERPLVQPLRRPTPALAPAVQSPAV